MVGMANAWLGLGVFQVSLQLCRLFLTSSDIPLVQDAPIAARICKMFHPSTHVRMSHDVTADAYFGTAGNEVAQEMHFA